MLDVGGQDATEAFEDVGHSDEAREILEGLLVGTVKRQPGDPTPKSSAQPTSSKTSGPDAAGLGAGLYAILLVGGALAYFAYSYLQAKGEVKN
jgi:cytochrome b involved in lipid metabolism